MNFEEIQKMWAGKDQKLDDSLTLDSQRMIAKLEARTSSALSDLGVALGWDLAIVLLFLGAMGALLLQLRWGVTLGFAAAIFLVTLAQGVAIVYQIRLFTHIDLAQPLLAVQERLTRLRISRLKLVKWSFFAWTLLWAPFLALCVQLLFGIDFQVFIRSDWWRFNGLSSIVLIGIGYAASHSFASVWEQSGFAQRLLDALAGKSMSQAMRTLKDLEEFKNG